MSSLRETVIEPQTTESTIRMALKSPKGEANIWIIVEGEDDYNLYHKFIRAESVLIEPVIGEDRRGGHAHVKEVVNHIKNDIPQAHIGGIVDADYRRYESYPPEYPENIFLTDQRDLEMMMLSADSVRQALKTWTGRFPEAFAICEPICRHFGYLRIYNHVNDVGCTFHDNLRTKKCWDYNTQALCSDWKETSTATFLEQVGGRHSEEDIYRFITERRLEEDSFYHVCRGHDLLPLLSLALIQTHCFSEKALMERMTKHYCMNDFKATQLYARLHCWQEREGVEIFACEDDIAGSNT